MITTKYVVMIKTENVLILTSKAQ